MIYIESKSKDPYYNLALEEYAFNHLSQGGAVFMLWQNSNTIVIGKNQNAAEEINSKFVEEHHIKVARRLSGGGAVYHDEGNLNFTFIKPSQGEMNYDFKGFVEPIIKALADLGVAAEFQGRNDIAIQGKKISGNSQYVKNGKVMHHGCIMLDSDVEKVTGALKVRPIKFKSKAVQSVRSRITTINENSPRKISMDEFKDAIKKRVLLGETITEYNLSREDKEAIKKLAAEKYSKYEWNYGFFPAYSIRREEKLEAGIVIIQMEVTKGRIDEISISGDFFGDGEISELEEKIKGLPLDEKLEEKIEGLEIEKYIRGISPKELAGLLK